MSNHLFVIGTPVKLTSGGPPMLVVDLDFDQMMDLVCVSWRTGKIVHEEWLPMSCLIIERAKQ